MDVRGDKVPNYKIKPEVLEGMKKIKFLQKKMELIKSLQIPQMTKADLFRKIRFDAEETTKSFPSEALLPPLGMHFPIGDQKIRY